MDHPTWEHLNEFVDGALPAAAVRETEEHLRTCPACHEEARDLRGVLAAAGRLGPGRDPEHDLWPGIRNGLPRVVRVTPDRKPSPPPRRRWLVPGFREGLAAVAALALLVAGARLLPREAVLPGNGSAASGFSPARAPLAEMIPSLVFGLERESRGAGRTLRTSYEAGRAAPAAETEGLDAGLRALDRAIGESLGALEQDPDNAALLRKVAVYYRFRLEILDREALRSGPA